MADTDRLAAALRYQQGMALPTPEPDSMVGRALDAAAQWGRGVQKNVSDLVSPTAWAEALKNPPRGVLSQMNPENKQEMINQGIDNALNFGPAMLGKIVYHGTPHRFPPTANNPLGEFDASKIGTGEGAQAYGVGAAYLAEAKSLAKHYRDVLAIDPRDSVNSVRAALSPSGNKDYWGAGANSPKLDDIYFEMKRHPNLQPYLNDSAFKKDIQKIINGTNPDGTVTDEAINILRRLDKTMPKPSGQLYKVDLADEQIPKMLDWDKPLKEQKPILDLLAAKLEGTKVGNALGVYKGNIPLLSLSGGNMAGAMPASAIGRDFLRHLGDIARKYDGNELNEIFRANGGKQDAAVSQFLQQNGITGIKYLDAGSRGAGEGTRNFIPFDPDHAKIIGRE